MLYVKESYESMKRIRNGSMVSGDVVLRCQRERRVLIILQQP